MLKKLILLFYFCFMSLFGIEVIWKEENIEQADVKKLYKEYIEKNYSDEVKKFKKSFILDKYGNKYRTVKSPYTEKLWLDRNLGASRVCTSYDDKQCYGDYFQWGRNSDGHEKHNSDITSLEKYSSNSHHNKFITSYINRNSLNSPDSKLWQRFSGINNPCPIGFIVPNINELKAEIININNKYDAFNNFLKLPSAGNRNNVNGKIYGQSKYGNIWTSSIASIYKSDSSTSLGYNDNGSNWDQDHKNYGQSVRCIFE